ncbi:hypothetical protein GCM10010327_19500 [Streptomyces nitrosporeus]|nr:hypothetical protein GCM10010327_19500 [Streptomyces nitrosporeus]
MDITPALRRRDVHAVVVEFYRRYREEDRLSHEEAVVSAVGVTVSAFRIMDESSAAYGLPPAHPVTGDQAREALTYHTP